MLWISRKYPGSIFFIWLISFLSYYYYCFMESQTVYCLSILIFCFQTFHQSVSMCRQYWVIWNFSGLWFYKRSTVKVKIRKAVKTEKLNFSYCSAGHYHSTTLSSLYHLKVFLAPFYSHSHNLFFIFIFLVYWFTMTDWYRHLGLTNNLKYSVSKFMGLLFIFCLLSAYYLFCLYDSLLIL